MDVLNKELHKLPVCRALELRKLIALATVKATFSSVFSVPQVAQDMISYFKEVWDTNPADVKTISRGKLLAKLNEILGKHEIVLTASELKKAMNQIGSVSFKYLVTRVQKKEGDYQLLREPFFSDFPLVPDLKVEDL